MLFYEEKEMNRRLTAPPGDGLQFSAELDAAGNVVAQHVVGYDAYADYADGYMLGLSQNHAVADRHAMQLALAADWMAMNTPNNVLLGYIHGKHRRETGSDCRAALFYAQKLGRSDHFPKPLVSPKQKKGKAIKSDAAKQSRWVPLSDFMEAAGITTDRRESKPQNLGEVAWTALSEILAK